MSSQRYSRRSSPSDYPEGLSCQGNSRASGCSTHSLYKWVRESRPAKAEADDLTATKLEMQKLKAAFFARDPK